MTATEPDDSEMPSARDRRPGGRNAVAGAAAAAFEKFTEELDHRAKQIEDTDRRRPCPRHADRDASASDSGDRIYRSAFPNRELDRLERELRRVAHRLGDTRDLDVMLEMLDDSRA